MATPKHRPEWLAFEQELGISWHLYGKTFPELWTNNIKLGKQLLKVYGEVLASRKPDPSITTHWTETSSGVRLKIYTPRHLRRDQPVVLFIHGGGLCIGSVAEEDAHCERLVKESGLVFISVEYRLAPEHPFPAGLDDCVEAAKWAVENGGKLGGKQGKIVALGGSAGGCLALGTALRLIDEGMGEVIQGVVAIQPMTVHPDAVPEELRGRYRSYEECADDTVNTAEAMRTFYDAHAAPITDPYISNILHPRVKDLPRVYINTAELDTLRDDGRLLKDKLEGLGVPTRHDEFLGVPHWFFSYPSKHIYPLADDYFSKTARGIDFVLESSSGSRL